jgi:Gpi18-like mannosyltransferase
MKSPEHVGEAAAAPRWRTRLAGYLRKVDWGGTAAVLIGLVLAVALRYSLLDFKSLDFFASLKPWYNTIKSEGFSAFATPFSTYNPPYLYLLYLMARFMPDLPVVVAVKLPALISDFVCAYIVYLMVGLKSRRRRMLSWLAVMIVLFAPSVVLNSAFWGQADSVFTAGMLACVYLLMIRRPVLAVLAFAIALAFKLQAIFLLPVLVALALKRAIPWKSLLLIPLVLLLALVPSWLAGRPVMDLIGVYLYQASQFEFITMNAANVYAWLPGTKQVFNLFYIPGVIVGLGAAFMWFIIVYRSPREITAPQVLEVALAAVLIIPYFLPKMHERYFYPADILAIVLAFFWPRLFLVPILIGSVSFLSYEPFLFNTELVPLPILALALLVAIGIVFHHSMLQLYAGDVADNSSRYSGDDDAA